MFNIMLQIMEDGRLTDSQGRHVDFKNTIIVMTSNVGAKNITEGRKQLGFSNNDGSEKETTDIADIREAVMKELRRTFKPEFLNRIDDIIVFHQLSRENIRDIAGNMFREVAERVKALGVDISVEPSALDVLSDKGFDPVYGARPLRRALQTMVEDVAAEKLLDGEFTAGDHVVAKGEDGKVLLTKV